ERRDFPVFRPLQLENRRLNRTLPVGNESRQYIEPIGIDSRNGDRNAANRQEFPHLMQSPFPPAHKQSFSAVGAHYHPSQKESTVTVGPDEEQNGQSPKPPPPLQDRD